MNRRDWRSGDRTLASIAFEVKGFDGVAKVDRRRDGIQLDVRRAELRVVVVAIFTDASHHVAGVRNGFPRAPGCLRGR